MRKLENQKAIDNIKDQELLNKREFEQIQTKFMNEKTKDNLNQPSSGVHKKSKRTYKGSLKKLKTGKKFFLT